MKVNMKKILVLNKMSIKKNYITQEEIKKYIGNKQKNKSEILNKESENLNGRPFCVNIIVDSTFQDSKDSKD
jgi:homospermidine synthase